jgi:hypothetical protein
MARCCSHYLYWYIGTRLPAQKKRKGASINN